MILLGYPFWAIGASTCSLAAGEEFKIASVRGRRRCSIFACGRVVGSRIFFPVPIDQIRGVFPAGFTIGVRCCVHVDSRREN